MLGLLGQLAVPKIRPASIRKGRNSTIRGPFGRTKSCVQRWRHPEKLTFVGLRAVRLMVPRLERGRVLFKLQRTNEGRFLWRRRDARCPRHHIRLRPDALQHWELRKYPDCARQTSFRPPKVFLRHSAMVVVAFDPGSEDGGCASRWTRPHH